MKKLRILIIVTLIIIIVSLCTIIFLKYKENNVDTDIDVSDYDANMEKNEKEELNEREQKDMVYTVEQCVNSYLDVINTNNSIYYGTNENGELIKLVNENESIYNILSNKFKTQNNISIDNIENYVEKQESDVFFIPLDMKYIKNDNLIKYLTHGYITDSGYNYIKDIILIVNLDFDNNTFSIEPVDDEADFDNFELDKNDMEQIEKNNNNVFKYVQATQEEISKKYLDYFKKMALSNTEELYNYLNEEYRDKRFENLENFQKYIENNRDTIKTLTLQKYLLNSYEGYDEYVCTDELENLYIFREYGPLDYEILLDTYTIPTEKFKETYDKSGDQYKVAMNVDRWIQMINNRDYKTAYSYLDETFRNNNFGSEEAFEQYMRERYPSHYDFELGESTETNGTYTQTIDLTDILGEDGAVIENTIIMQLLDNYEFVMSFGVN